MASATVAWKPITEQFGAEIDIDLSKDLDPAGVEELRRLFDERHMLYFRNQDIDYETQRKFAALFGNIIPSKGDAKYLSTHHNTEGERLKKARRVDPRVQVFHSDLTYVSPPPVHGICLFAENVSSDQAGTRFIGLRNVLSDADRAALEGRTAINIHGLTLSAEEHVRLRDVPVEEVKATIDYWAEQPLLFPHPRTGETNLLYGPMQTHSIVGMSRQESQAWFDRFEALLYDESRMYTHRWQNNDLLIWDNFVVQHAKELVDESGPVKPRVLRRAVLGRPYEIPGVDVYAERLDAAATAAAA